MSRKKISPLAKGVLGLVRDSGFSSLKAFCGSCGLPYNVVVGLLSGRESPFAATESGFLAASEGVAAALGLSSGEFVRMLQPGFDSSARLRWAFDTDSPFASAEEMLAWKELADALRDPESRIAGAARRRYRK